MAVSVQVPAVWVQLEVIEATGPEIVRAPPVFVVKFLERFSRFPESATVVVYVAV